MTSLNPADLRTPRNDDGPTAIDQMVHWLGSDADAMIRQLSNAHDDELDAVAAIGARLIGAVQIVRKGKHHAA